MSKRVWVQGPIAIDTVVYVEKFPLPGTFMNSTRTEERTGGTSANIALGLCTTGVETNFVGYLGNDGNGKKLREVLDKSEIKHSIITEIDGPTSNALILIDDKAILAPITNGQCAIFKRRHRCHYFVARRISK